MYGVNTMAEALLFDILDNHVDLERFCEWMSGKENKNISKSLSRADFVLHTLNHIQENASKFIILSSTLGKEKDVSGTPEQKKPVENSAKTPDNELISNHRKPFQVINRVTPQSAVQPFSRLLNNGNDTRREMLNSSINYETRNITTSTPVHPHRRNSGRDQFSTSPRSTCSSLHSDHSSISHTPRSNKSSANKFNSSNGSHKFSPQSNSPSFSPTSPQYVESFPDLGTRGRSRTPHSPCLADFIVTKPNSQKSRKRIKPTQLTSDADVGSSNDSKQSNKNFGVVNRPFVPLTSPQHLQSEVKEKSNFEEERSLLKQKRSNFENALQPTQPLQNDLLSKSVTELNGLLVNVQNEQMIPKQILARPRNAVASPSANIIPGPENSVEPDPSKIVCADKLLRLATVYSACLDSNLVPNITTELYFIFTLLTFSYKSQIKVPVNENHKNKICEVAADSVNKGKQNKACVVPFQQLCLDETINNPATNIPLEENCQLKDKDGIHQKSVLCSAENCVMFAAVMIEKQIHLVQSLDKSVIRLLLENTRLSLFLPHFIPHLTHILETKEVTESRSTLARKPLFLSNRPVLYNTETDTESNFSSKNNFFSFKKQRDGFYEILHEWRTKNSDNFWTSSRFPRIVTRLLELSCDPVNMMHLARLFCAQLTSSSSEKANSELELPGVTKDKLFRLEARLSKPQMSARGPRPPPQFPGEQQFYQQFLEVAEGSPLLAHVVDCLLHRICLLDSTSFFVDGFNEEESKVQVLTCVSDCCLLAKFMGLAVFMPYRSDTLPPPDTLQAQVLVRQMVTPPVDVTTFLQRALANNRLVVTVPWVVAYLGMMDSAAPLLSCYRQPLQMLADLYLTLPLPHITPPSSLLLRCALGWLFDPSFFPETVFHSLVTSGSSVKSLDRSCETPVDVDVRDVVDQALLSEVCPFLGSFRLLLSTSTGDKRGTVRHIRPVPAHHAPATVITPVQTVEMELEESFLSSQAPSFRATVEFVAERISSSCIKHICSNVIAPCKEEASTLCNKQKEENKKLSKKEVQTQVEEACQTTLARIHTALDDHCGPQVGQALRVLLGPDATDPAILSSAHNICGRRCRERIINWLNSHIKLSNIFTKIFNGLDTKQNGEQTTGRKDVEHKDLAMSPPELLIELQERLCQCIENRNLSVSEEQVLDLIDKVMETIKHRSDLVPHAEQTLHSITVDYCIVLMAHCPGVLTTEVLHRLCSLWLTFVPQSTPLERVLSSRNVLLLCQSGLQVAQASWRQLSRLLVLLLKEELLAPKQLEAQFVALFRKDWPPMVHSLMGTCLSSMLELIRQDPKCNKNPKFLLMLEWANEMMNELARDDICEDS
uniref:Codanin-1 C-terminal domain-containing protein n=1 Tax=Homalodisca liturata TaxID=320908 RepID=A0A1B6I8B5_9HEMI